MLKDSATKRPLLNSTMKYIDSTFQTRGFQGLLSDDDALKAREESLSIKKRVLS